jgi:ATP-dependent helicase Lhr and Lhr-like helicase
MPGYPTNENAIAQGAPPFGITACRANIGPMHDTSATNPLPYFHPAVAAWFGRAFPAPTPAQAEAWPALKAGSHVLIAAPTGSGKTLAAFLAAIDSLIRQGLKGELKDETQIVYVSPLKALSNDVEKNLVAPLKGIREELQRLNLPDVQIRTLVRTGDTPQNERSQMRKRPPHILVTTPESLYILLTSASGRVMLATARTVIADEIHALAPNKRGAHLALSLERLSALCGPNLTRAGLTATAKPIEEIAHFLVGARPDAACKIIDTGHDRARDLAIELPPSPLEAVMAGEVWEQVYNRLSELIGSHRSTLVFVNTRRMAERAARALSERLGTSLVTAHHGSLAKEQRLDAEQRLKCGKLKALVATASLELGIDIGEVDLVCQLGSPRSIAAFLQRVGRSGHAVSGVPKGRLFPLSRDDLAECAALLDSVRRGELDQIVVPSQPLDVLAQQIAAEVSAREWQEDALFGLMRRAWPYLNLTRADFSQVLAMLAEGFSTRRGRRGALIHHDAVNHIVRSRRGTRLTAITSGGAIPENADYRVVLEPENQFIGTVHEDFAVESMKGDIFQLGNQSYSVLRVERGTVRVADAHGLPPTIPFWLGEAPGRTKELSRAVSRLLEEVARRIDSEWTGEGALAWLCGEVGLCETAAQELLGYLAAGKAALGALPTQETLIFERFFDESGGMQFIVHSPYGVRINRAWGLALRKRFCRKFNFELQAAATDDNILLSLTEAHSFELAEVQRYLNSRTVRSLLTQALLDAPMFLTRWRWVAGIALALPRYRGGRKVPAYLARMNAEDLIGAVFPDQLACAENIVGEREIPDHPLVRQTIADCLDEAMDIAGLERLMAGLESGAIRVLARDLTEPSPLALEVLAARPYAFLDDAPLEERRAQAVMARRWLAPEMAADLGKLDPAAIARVREEAWPDAENADELHDALLWLTFLTEEEARNGPGWSGWLEILARESRVLQLDRPGASLWIAAERLSLFKALWPDVRNEPARTLAASPSEQNLGPETALIAILRGRLEGKGPVTADALAAPLGIAKDRVEAALTALETEGFIMRGRFSPETAAEEWCERRLLARIHNYTVKRLRAEIEPVSASDFLRFLIAWQRAAPNTQMEGPEAVFSIVEQLEGFEAPAYAWEREILPARLANYDPAWLDEQCHAGRITWARLRPRGEPLNGNSATPKPSSLRTAPITLLTRRRAAHWVALPPVADGAELSANAQAVAEFLRAHGASFFDELREGTSLLRAQTEEALAELAAMGCVTSDSFAGLRALLTPLQRGHRLARTARIEQAGRWALARRNLGSASLHQQKAEAAEQAARKLLLRYGIVFRRLLDREAPWLPQWRDLLNIYRRLEARGEIRGGRFVAGFAGEQFALPEAAGKLRKVRREAPAGEIVSLSGADPLNLIGILTLGTKLPVLASNRLLYRDGVPAALFSGGEVEFLATLDTGTQWEFRKRLLRSPPSGGSQRTAPRAKDLLVT